MRAVRYVVMHYVFVRYVFWSTVHNVISHPVSHLLWLASGCGLVPSVEWLADWVHDVTVPREWVTDDDVPAPSK